MIMDYYSPCPKRKIWPFLKGSHISAAENITPTKNCVHACDINPYLHKFFYQLNFLMTMDYSPCPKKKIWPFLKGSHISATEEATPAKNCVHACDINPYLHKFFEPNPIN